MTHLRRAVTTIVVAVFTAGLVSVSAPANAADDGVTSAKSISSSLSTNARRDTGWS